MPRLIRIARRMFSGVFDFALPQSRWVTVAYGWFSLLAPVVLLRLLLEASWIYCIGAALIFWWQYLRWLDRAKQRVEEVTRGGPDRTRSDV